MKKYDRNPHHINRSRIGIITGSGPDAGIDLFSKLIRANRQLIGEVYRGDLDAPEVVIFSVPELGLSMELANNDVQVWQAMQRTATNLAEHVDYYGIACNTLNFYAERLAALGLAAQLISVADVVRDYLSEQKIKRVALLGARPVMDLGAWSAYQNLSQYAEVELPTDFAALHQIIYDVKQYGGDTPEIISRFEAILNELKADVVLLACTELPLIPCIRKNSRIIDVTDLLAAKLAKLSLTQRPVREEVNV